MTPAARQDTRAAADSGPEQGESHARVPVRIVLDVAARTPTQLAA
ncbi:hypothetical protein [Rhodopirellula europaea]